MNKEVDLTTKEIKKMIKEEITTSPFDSGGAYGYSFKENKKVKNFDETPKCKFYLKDGIDFQINVYHWLKNMFDSGYLPKLTENLQSKCGWWDKWDKWLDETFGEENYLSFNKENSDNYKNFLSQPVLYRFFAVTKDGVEHADRALNGLDEEFVASNIEKSDKIYSDPMYVILSLHNGCDVRGGYTDPRVFRITTYDGVAGFYSTMESANVRCKKCDFYMMYIGEWMIEKPDGLLISISEKMPSIDTKLNLNEEISIHKFDGDIYKKIKDCTIEEFIESTGRCPICGSAEFNAWFDYE